MLNRIFLIGNLTRDPEVRYLPSGTAVTTFDLAVNERYRDRNQELREETLFIQVETFQRQAETCAQYLKKGSRALVEGKLRLDTWEAKDGTKRSRHRVRGLQVTFLDPRGSESGGGAPSQDRPQPQQADRSEPQSRTAAPQTASPARQDVPEVDINDPSPDYESEPSSTDDDLPF
jgi:single-strand DNA-binding protein